MQQLHGHEHLIQGNHDQVKGSVNQDYVAFLCSIAIEGRIWCEGYGTIELPSKES
jgi:calcineurin-like phosphoesterase family protein